MGKDFFAFKEMREQDIASPAFGDWCVGLQCLALWQPSCSQERTVVMLREWLNREEGA